MFPLITASENPDNPPGASKSCSPSTSQTACTVLAADISVHNIVRHNRDIYLSKSPSVEWVLNQPNAASAYGNGLVRPPPTCPDILREPYHEAGGEEILPTWEHKLRPLWVDSGLTNRLVTRTGKYPCCVGQCCGHLCLRPTRYK